MDQKTQEFLKRLRATFKVEAAEHLGALSSGLVELEKPSAAENRGNLLEQVFREMHSLKGAARAVNATEMETLCHSLESVFSAWKRKEIAPSVPLFDLLHRAANALEEILASLDAERSAVEASSLTAPLIQALENARKGILPRPMPAPEVAAPPAGNAGQLPEEPKPAPAETVRIPVARLDGLLLEAEELISAKLAAARRAVETREIRAAVVPWKKTRVLLRTEVRAGKLRDLQEADDRFFSSLESRLAALDKATERDHRSLERWVNQLLKSAKAVVMVPAWSLLESFPKLVRDLAHDRGKSVELAVQGAEIEIDRRILEEMKDPLVHLVRNCIDHGIEDPQKREAAKKPPQGTIHIRLCRRNGDKAELIVSDDGAGILVADVRAALLKKGILPAEEVRNLNDEAALAMIFESGVSTSPILTDLSGRGLGLAIVREKVEKLGGTISLETSPGSGTTFRMVLPLMRATFRGVVVRLDRHLFVLPTVQVEQVLRFRRQEARRALAYVTPAVIIEWLRRSGSFVLPTLNVQRILRIKPETIQTVENRETLTVQGRAVSLVRLRDVLDLPMRNAFAETKIGQAVLLGSGEKRIAFVVDEVLHEQEVLVKTLGKQFSGVRDLAGATILETGRVVPVLDVPSLMKSAVRISAAPPSAAVSGLEPPSQKSILVAEDSITSRTLLKNILESAGYQVQTAVDGAEVFAALKTTAFDLVVSDVDMPRMNGFDLTAKIRAIPKFAELPVVLVTSLESREDRERGIDAGANAYIVKSSFDQSNLLEILRRLL